jgi:hypothetical protein
VTDSETIDERTVAYHEAGHAIQFALEGCEIEFVKLTFVAENLGVIKPHPASSAKLTNEQHVRVSLAGLAAELVLKQNAVPSTAAELFDIVNNNDGWCRDWDRAYCYALRLVGEEEYEAANELRFQLFHQVFEMQTRHRDDVALVANRLRRERRLSGEALLDQVTIPRGAR